MRLVRLLPLLPLLAACASDGDDGGPRVLRLDGSLEDCQNVQQICAESFPPQCFDYCADEDPGMPPDGDCTDAWPPDDGDGDSDGGEAPNPGTPGTIVCGDDPCVSTTDESGVEYQICYPPDCTVSHDTDTGETIVECPPGCGGGGGGGGSSPGDPGEPSPTCEVDGQPGFEKSPDGTCADEGTVCTAIPEACIEIWSPVCGCDGVTYANGCFADGNAVSVAHLGECEEASIDW